MDWISINTDSAVKHGVAGCGGVLRDHRGFWIKGFARNNGTTSAFIAELWGAYDGLCLARRSSFINIELQLDFMVVVKALEGAHLGNSGGRSLVRRIRSLIHEGWNVRIRHVYREGK
jgi:ribonuclease HI